MIRALIFIPVLFIFISLFNVTTASSKKAYIPLNQWTSQRVVSQALGDVLSNHGVQVEYINISVDEQWGALQRGKIHFQLEVWQPSMAQAFSQLTAKQAIVDMGLHDAKVTEDWWYPKYVEELCPELPHWRALITCKSLFVEKDSKGKGVYYAGPWDYNDADVIRALKLDFTINRSSGEMVLWKKLSKAIKQKKPIIILNWSPNWTDKHLSGRFIQFPAYAPECETKPEWGINKHLTRDCANPKDGWLKKAAWPGLKAYNPCVFQFVKTVNLSNEMIADAASFVITQNNTEHQAASLWMKKYQSQIVQWLSKTCLRG
ncbi:ABC transporter substrate-binding protein [Litorilituus lipolyticus]|uniref:Glycine/betaine ABC transporter substrate-binding protein n=1 Tax=Litorilituus lipolyticus TaxID=2491017 RepID=A0A502KV82_9GAMM|nr:ABC transporter substrate-binding protein [Litorilituus lipolyticus]TPH12147.1 glycine/betaine ABC transporter substrate-binding protein [Litorilituus lipolyticus]